MSQSISSERSISSLRDSAAAAPMWWSTVDQPFGPSRTGLASDVHVDVAIVGGGFSGLWTAVRLSELQPSARIVVIEKNFVGFGASGRNGGWCSAIMPMSLDSVAKKSSREGAIAMQRTMNDAVLEIGQFAITHSLEIDFALAGWLKVARSTAQVERAHEYVAERRSWGFGDEDARWVNGEELAEKVRVAGALGAVLSPMCAAIHPAKLVRGLARVAEDRGVVIYEGTRVTHIHPKTDGRTARVVTDGGTITADVVVRATEGYTAELPGLRRNVAPIYSLMVATEPLGKSVWDEIGWADRATLNDGRNSVIYAQRTADNRIAFGGRGAPYHFGSTIKPSFDLDDDVHGRIIESLHELFPAVSNADITHRWGGPLGATRDWFAGCGYDPATGLAWTGGYVGDGVASAYLGGVTVAECIAEAATDRTRMAWVSHQSRRWEPEPLRWAGINLGLLLPDMIDKVEAKGKRAPVRSRILASLVGH